MLSTSEVGPILALKAASMTEITKVKINKCLAALRAKIGPTSDVDNIFSKMYSQYVLFRNKYS
jgi:hypothetical protein